MSAQLSQATLYADGGLMGDNPCELGGTWAWCLVDAAGERFAWANGVVLPSGVGLPAITNNMTELLAVLYGMQRLPDGWGGVICTDSRVTFCRVGKRPDGNPNKSKFKGVPQAVLVRLRRQQLRLGRYKMKLLGGHPDPLELAAGVRSDGMPVSSHNVFCDEKCFAARELYLGGLYHPGRTATREAV